MTTISHNRRRNPSFGRFIALLLVLIILAVGFMWRAQASALFWQIASPVMELRNRLGETEASRLRAELASTTALLSDRDALYAENVALKAELGRDAKTPSLRAAIIARPPAVPYDTLVLDVGKQNGVALNDAVYASGSLYLGKITEVFDTTSRAELLSSPGTTLDAFVHPKNGGAPVPVSLAGAGAGSISGDVPADSNVAEGDDIIIPSIALTTVGEVSYVSNTAGASFSTVFLALPVSLFDLEYVEVRHPLP